MVWSGIGDAVIITYVVVSTGGTASPFLFLYVVQVLTSALVVDTVAGAVSAALSVGCWALATLARPAARALPGAADRATPAAPSGRASLALTLVLLVFIGGYLAQRLARRERELAGAHRRLRRSMERLARAHAELGDAYGRLARAEAQIVSTEKMRSLGVLVAGLAHELGNPLTVLAGNLEPLEEHFADVRTVRVRLGATIATGRS